MLALLAGSGAGRGGAGAGAGAVYHNYRTG